MPRPYKPMSLRWPFNADQLRNLEATLEDIYQRLREGLDRTLTLSGDVTGSGTDAITTTLASVNSNVGSFGDGTHIPTVTVDAKGRVTAASQTTFTAGQSQGQILTRVFLRG